jgi:hypothetical protein
MNQQRMDADTAETVAGVVRLLHRAAQLVWEAADADGFRSPRQMLALAIDLAADEARNLHVLHRRWRTWCGRRTPVSASDYRTLDELLADSEALAREILLDATPEQAPVQRV